MHVSVRMWSVVYRFDQPTTTSQLIALCRPPIEVFTQAATQCVLHPASAQDQQLPWSILRWEGITDELLAKRALHMA
jgi:hypothetical protein